ncbi:ankyrin repeat domain-containing protein [Amycolatopsis rhizosphaerae]|uniref:Ankyrin repeat domain-containing protein n=1 Tax=Amycolatopsis rhizosphaerae TaxID=2053003 RepID=A0A558DNP1_9PSEU|nr:ankyrin repeat domain-containing protein [Amycolatopsis rhizosphaerae]TVT62627.1 ankyrin repeat domain-containing protein [Amycolatopsis rhizosphaerae]
MYVDNQGRTPLHAAALRGDPAEVEQLIAAGADPSTADNNGFTPLHLAAQEGHVGAARALLDGGAEIDRRNRFGNTALFVAVFNSRGRGDLILLLRERGADPMAENASGQTPIGLARLIANFDVAQYFADLGEF